MRSSFVFRNTVFVSKDTGWPVGLQLFVVRVAKKTDRQTDRQQQNFRRDASKASHQRNSTARSQSR
eukprot:scaffold123635_cov78-Phaeocystis_antarctica.AAC.1